MLGLEPDLARCRGVLDRVVEQEQQHLFEVVGVAANDGVTEQAGLGQHQPHAVGHLFCLPADGVQHLGEPDQARLDRGTGVGPGEDEQLAHHPAHAVGLGGDACQCS